MKTVIIVLIAGIVLSQLGISAATLSENSAARNLAAAKSFAFGGVGVAGLMSEGERNLRVTLEQSDASQDPLLIHVHRPHSVISSFFPFAYGRFFPDPIWHLLNCPGILSSGASKVQFGPMLYRVSVTVGRPIV